MKQVTKEKFYDKINPTNAKATLMWDDSTRCVTSTFTVKGLTIAKAIEIRTKGVLSTNYYLKDYE
jgi:hypothetical protein